MISEFSGKEYSVLIDIWESAVLATHDFLSKEDFQFYKSRLPLYFENVKLYVFKDEYFTVKGFLGVSEDQIEMLFVENESRGMGIGKKLLNFAVDSLGLKKVDVNEQNTQALGFYEYKGFKRTGYMNCDSEGKNYPIVSLELA